MIATLALLAACGDGVVAREFGTRAHASLRGARVEKSRNFPGEQDDPPDATEIVEDALEGKELQVAEEVLQDYGVMPSQADCEKSMFLKWEVEGHDDGKEQGVCKANDIAGPVVYITLFTLHFGSWFACCRKRKRSVKGPYAKVDLNYIQSLDYLKPIGSNSVHIFELLWWWFMCFDNWAGPMQTIKALANVIESTCCFCWMHADTLTRAGVATNLNAYSNGCLMCMGPCYLFPCFWVSSYRAALTRNQILKTVDSKYEVGLASDLLIHCCFPVCTNRQEAELVEWHKAFENGQPIAAPPQQGMKGKGKGKPKG
jgi:hypothetical protein